MSQFRSIWLGCLLFACWGALPLVAVPLPPAPSRYVEDKAGILSPAEAERLNGRLENFEKETSNQVVVAIYPKLPEGAELAQFSTETFEAWGVGQKKKDNGVVLFIFSQDRKVFIATGRGLEGALPDAICKTIITREIVPRFRQSDFPGGVNAAVDSIMAAAKGEYQGTGSTVAGNRSVGMDVSPLMIFLIIIFIVISVIRSSRSGSTVYTRRGSRTWFDSGGWGGGGSGGWGGGGGGGSSGGFSGGGGGTSGGGAGGSW